ncbi:UDP-glucose/GDP-mannose dehydrogenase family protein [Alkalinema sp. FACHB-956]|uniref:UDP-glucose dehydrogenase family protein n=1 Tax=Alkalinema sp. FACHB-956 TaxID=2692768 RepID=UPI0016869818|nr:UDP-glucose/GDP-mannose dehydrogenase family protein [Alkalinema sp. FACHB-956]MBD2327267.1 UDP-glucose/GDP-mannose dehydrogenase family protein [Alkalinema sp. FACHB-956]
MQVSIIGTGYVGLVSGVCFADKGHQVVCVDIDPNKVEKINQGFSPFYEPGLDELLERNIHSRLKATTDFRQAILDTDVSLIAVGTPFDGREVDLTYVKQVAQQIGEALKDKSTYHLVIVKSTVVPGTTDQVVLPILEAASGKKAGVDFGVGMNPEFLTEGEAISDFMYPDRIVLGGIDDRSIDLLDQLYEGFDGVDRLRTNNSTAEMIKYTSNSLLALLISFSNEIGNLCAAIGNTDIVEVMQGVHNSRYLTTVMPNGDRIVPPITSFLAAGCGFGGSCLPKDVKALIAHGEKYGSPMPLLDAVIQVNQAQPKQVIARLHKHFPSLEGVRVAILGLSFRPNTNDMRESPAIPIVRDLLAQKAILKAYDPVANAEAQHILGADALEYCDSLNQVLEGVQAVVLVTRWDEFRSVPELLTKLDPQPVFVDGRRLLDQHSIAKYEGIGL